MASLSLLNAMFTVIRYVFFSFLRTEHVYLIVINTGNPTPVMTWSKNGEKTILHGSLKRSKWSLTLEAIAQQDSGQYTCTASNIHGSLNFTFSLTVQGK